MCCIKICSSPMYRTWSMNWYIQQLICLCVVVFSFKNLAIHNASVLLSKIIDMNPYILTAFFKITEIQHFVYPWNPINLNFNLAISQQSKLLLINCRPTQIVQPHYDGYLSPDQFISAYHGTVCWHSCKTYYFVAVRLLSV